jgi:hypothetical protein
MASVPCRFAFALSTRRSFAAWKQHSHSLVDRSTLDHTVTPTLSLSAFHSLSRPIANQSSGTPISTPDSFQPQP